MSGGVLHWLDKNPRRIHPKALIGAEIDTSEKCGVIRQRARDEGDTREIEMRILGTPTAGHTLRVQIIDNNPPGSSSAMDELRFRGRSYPVGTQAANMYVICIDTSYEPEKVVIQWERPTIRFYRYYGEEAGYRQKAMLRFTWSGTPMMLQGRRLTPLPIVVDRPPAPVPTPPPDE